MSQAPDDDRDLRWLAIGHYAVAVMTLAVGALYTGFSLLINAFVRAATHQSTQTAQEATAAEAIAGMTVILGVAAGVYFLSVVGSLVAVGVLTSRRRGYRVCLALSAFSTTSAMFWNPFAPVAAGFAYKLLRRPTVQVQFPDTQFPEGAETRGAWDLKVLSLSCYVFAAFNLVSGMSTAAFVMRITSLPIGGGNEDAATMHGVLGPVMIAFAALAVLVSIGTYALLGYLLSKARYRGACMGLSILLLFSFPFGTLIGVFLLILLNRSDVVAIFEGLASAAPVADEPT